ncbi:MAG: hypothetical protein PUC41_00170 [Oscillospiraceae bacterium]|nr:hypothetical protein [Oscillospiraceae bacterium]
MKKSTVFLLCLLTVGEGALAIFLYTMLSATPFTLGKYLALIGVIGLSLLVDWLILKGNSAASASDARRLKDAHDYIAAFEAWLREDTAFPDEMKIALRQLQSLERKQKALQAILANDADSPFLQTAAEVEEYILNNCKRVLNRVMIYDPNEPQNYQTHLMYLRQVLGQNAHVLSDFDNLILEVSQIGEDHSGASTPCLNELTAALRSVRNGGTDVWANGQITQAPTGGKQQQPPTQMMQ